MTPAESGITSLDVPPGITSRLSRPRLLPKVALNPLVFFSALRPIIYFSSRQRASLPAAGNIIFAFVHRFLPEDGGPLTNNVILSAFTALCPAKSAMVFAKQRLLHEVRLARRSRLAF